MKLTKFNFFKDLYSLEILFPAFILSFFRQPLYFSKPRIWAEDGTIYLNNAIDNSFWNIFDPSNTGLSEINYYSFYTNFISHLSANIFPISYAAHVNTYASFLFQILTCIVIYKSIYHLFKNKYICIFLALSPIFLSSPEIWLSLISVQYWGSTGLIFILNAKKQNFSNLIYSFLAFFTGSGSLFILPFFLLKVIKDKKKDFFLNYISLIGITAFVIQLKSFLESDADSLRFQIDFLKNLPRGLVSSFFPRFINTSNSYLPISTDTIYNPFTLFIIFLFILLACISIIICLKSENHDQISYGLLMPIFSYWLLSTISSMNMAGGERYGLPVYCGLTFVILLAFEYQKNKVLNLILVFIFSFIYILRIPVYFDTFKFYDPSWLNWKEQVEERTLSEAYVVKVFPQWKNFPSWELSLPPLKNR